MVKAYAKGAAFERKVKKELEARGYIVVRSAKSAFPDLVALATRHSTKLPGSVTFIECKSGGRLSREEIKKAEEIAITGTPFWLAENVRGKIKFKEFGAGKFRELKDGRVKI